MICRTATADPAGSPDLGANNHADTPEVTADADSLLSGGTSTMLLEPGHQGDDSAAGEDISPTLLEAGQESDNSAAADPAPPPSNDTLATPLEPEQQNGNSAMPLEPKRRSEDLVDEHGMVK